MAKKAWDYEERKAYTEAYRKAENPKSLFNLADKAGKAAVKKRRAKAALKKAIKGVGK